MWSRLIPVNCKEGKVLVAGDVLDKIHNVLNIVNNEFKYTRKCHRFNCLGLEKSDQIMLEFIYWRFPIHPTLEHRCKTLLLETNVESNFKFNATYN